MATARQDTSVSPSKTTSSGLLHPHGRPRGLRRGSSASSLASGSEDGADGSASSPGGGGPSNGTRLRAASSPRLPTSPLRHSSLMRDNDNDLDPMPDSPSLDVECLSNSDVRRVKPNHRHAKALDRAFAQLASFAPNRKSVSIRADLERDGWHYAGTRQGVHIYSREPSAGDLSRKPPPGFPHAVPFDKEDDRPNLPSSPSVSSLEDTALPYFRGEGWLPGSWRPSDIAATVGSIPARALFEARVDGIKSSTVQILDEASGDALKHLYIRGQFPVGARDQSIVAGYRELSNATPKGQPLGAGASADRGWFVGTSVEDKLVPEAEGIQRSWIYLSGLAIARMPRPPLYDLPDHPDNEPAPISGPHAASAVDDRPGNPGGAQQPPQGFLATSNNKPRYESLGHTIQTLSGDKYLQSPSPMTQRVGWSEWDWTMGSGSGSARMASGPAVGPTSSALTNNGVPRPKSGLFGSRRNRAATPMGLMGSGGQGPDPQNRAAVGLTREGRGMSSSVLPTLGSSPVTPWDSPEDELPKLAPGCHLSYMIRIDPRGHLPVTFVNQLSLTTPLLIANIRRYMTKYGFVPHLCRTTSTVGARLIGEELDPVAGEYKIQFSLGPMAAGGTTRIRFHGSTFNRGRFEISVIQATDWHIDFDTPPKRESDLGEDEEGLVQEKLPPDPKAKKTSIRMRPINRRPAEDLEMAAPLSALSDSASEDFTAPMRASPRLSLTLQPFQADEDPADLPGARGGCTCVIKNTVIGPTIQVTISKSHEKPAFPLGAGLRRAMETIGRVAVDPNRPLPRVSSMEDLTRSGKARRSLDAARHTMEQVMKLREEEGLPPGLIDTRPANGSGSLSRSGSFSKRPRSRAGSRRSSTMGRPPDGIIPPGLVMSSDDPDPTSPTSGELSASPLASSPLGMRPLTKGTRP